MDSKVRHNSANADKYVQHALDEMDKNIQSEREEMDNTVRQERAAVDRVMKQEREHMDKRLKQMHEETEKKVKFERDDIDQKLRQDRAAMDRALQQEHQKMEKQLKKIHKDMDKKIQQERNDMDLAVELDRARMDSKIMHTRANVEHKLQQDREDMHSKDLLEQVYMEAKMMQDCTRVDPKATTDQIQFQMPSPEQLNSKSSPGVVMDFTVHVDFREETGSMIICEPETVRWSLMVENLMDHGYKGNADLYYLEPGCVPPKGMVLISGPDDVQQMMLAHKGRKKCDLYIFRNGPPSDDSDGGMSEEGQFNQNIDSWEPADEGKWDVDEDGSSRGRTCLWHNVCKDIKKMDCLINLN